MIPGKLWRLPVLFLEDFIVGPTTISIWTMLMATPTLPFMPTLVTCAALLLGASTPLQAQAPAEAPVVEALLRDFTLGAPIIEVRCQGHARPLRRFCEALALLQPWHRTREAACQAKGPPRAPECDLSEYQALGIEHISVIPSAPSPETRGRINVSRGYEQNGERVRMHTSLIEDRTVTRTHNLTIALPTDPLQEIRAVLMPGRDEKQCQIREASHLPARIVIDCT